MALRTSRLPAPRWGFEAVKIGKNPLKNLSGPSIDDLQDHIPYTLWLFNIPSGNLT